MCWGRHVFAHHCTARACNRPPQLKPLTAHCPLASPPSPTCALCSLVSEALGVALPSTILFDYPSIEALCGYILATQVRGWLRGHDLQQPAAGLPVRQQSE